MEMFGRREEEFDGETTTEWEWILCWSFNEISNSFHCVHVFTMVNGSCPGGPAAQIHIFCGYKSGFSYYCECKPFANNEYETAELLSRTSLTGRQMHHRQRFDWFTCSHKENSSSQDDVPFALIEATSSDAHTSHQQQDGAEDGEDVGSPHYPCREVKKGTVLEFFIC